MEPVHLPQKFLKRKESIIAATYFTEAQNSFSQLCTILSIPVSQRTPQQVRMLVSFSRHIKFFDDLSNDISDEAHFQCCQCMTYDMCTSGNVTSTQFVFHSGEEGTKFYIILSGSCAVLAPYTRIDGKSDFKQLTVLRQGECFGELALISNKPRAASILCREDSQFAVLERQDYVRILGKIQDNKLQEKVDVLQRLPVFAKWTKNSVQRLSYFFKVQMYKRKQALFSSGQSVKEIYLIKHGEFQLEKDVFLTAHSNHTNKSTRYHLDVTLVSAGEILGAEEFIKGTVFSYTCLCYSTQAEVMAISKDDFKQVMVSEETVDYLLRMNNAKEGYRRTRVLTAMRVEQEKRSMRSVSPEKTPTAGSESLRKALVKEKIRFLSKPMESKPPGTAKVNYLFSPILSPNVSQNIELMGASGDIPKIKPRHVPSKSWSEVFLSKYSMTSHPQSTTQKHPVIVNFHTKRLKTIGRKLHKLQNLVLGNVTENELPAINVALSFVRKSDGSKSRILSPLKD